jgi:beta-glucanase (GH16 family)
LPFANGTWPAFWNLGKNINESGAYWQTQGFGTTGWPACGEIDVMEHGLHAVNEVSSALHTTSSSGNTQNTSRKQLDNVAENYHVYSINWSPNKITFLIDGVGYYNYKPSNKNVDTWPFNKEQYLLLNIAMGGIAGAIDANFTQSSMVIDYVRVYQNTNTASVDNVYNSKFSIFPNPAEEIFSISSDEKIDKVELYSTLGQLIFRENNVTKNIRLRNVNTGLYLVKIYFNNKIATKKLLVKK